MNFKVIVLLFTTLGLLACTASEEGSNKEETEMEIESENGDEAQIVSVTVSGSENNYTFNIGVESPDTGCDQYADWWEIITEKGELIYRRILAHSHVDEQPFVRSGGVVEIESDQIVIIRAHMNTSGFGRQVFKGNVENGFSSFMVEADFAGALSQIQPLPTDCAF